MPEPDWFPSRVDLWSARRWERARLALIANLFFLFGLCAFGWFGCPRNDTLAFVPLFLLLPLAISVRGYSFLVASRRKQMEERFRPEKGSHVECRFYEDDLELGRDSGYLFREGGLLRFEGTRSCFALASSSLAEAPNLEDRNPDLVLRDRRIAIRPERTADADTASVLLGRWIREGGEGEGQRMPPRDPQPRRWTWYLERAIEQRYAAPMGLCMPLAWIFSHLLSKPGEFLGILILCVPIPIFAGLVLIAASRLRRDEEIRLAARASRVLSLNPVESVETEPPTVSVGTPVS